MKTKTNKKLEKSKILDLDIQNDNNIENVNNDYYHWLFELKSHIKQSQIKASLTVNRELVLLYWDLGKQINEKLESAIYGSKIIDKLSRDLKKEFPQMSGFSRTNLYTIKNFYLYYFQIDSNDKKIVHPLGGQSLIQNENNQEYNSSADYYLNLCCQIPWKHNTLLIDKVKDKSEILFYLIQTIQNNWSRSVLEYHIETKLHKRQGKAINNFELTLPKIESDLANQLLKDPYNFEFLSMTYDAKERDLENKLIEHITQFLLELGKGFAYLGKQYEIKVGEKGYYTDLLFYHVKLKCYFVIELKMTEFMPEYIGKLNFYINAIDETLKDDFDKPTIGILLCKNKDDFEVEFAIKKINSPIGVSEFKYSQINDNNNNEFKNDLENKLKSEFTIELTSELKRIVKK
ncbi:MAG: PDDEXK nuclease domain-containing protein [Candidatus Kapabacteria bacterium]|nr:PDDEXK nuclease domain-containing protein [Candidatus Kapabacteria bacterium]